MNIKIPSFIQKIQTLADGGNKVEIVTQELSPSDMAAIFELKGKLGWFVFSENPAETIEIPKEKVEFQGQKTPSQRLHDRMLVYYKSKKGSTDGFEVWRAAEMDRIGQGYLDKIEK